jgi:signal transduction histidine kinase
VIQYFAQLPRLLRNPTRQRVFPPSDEFRDGTEYTCVNRVSRRPQEVGAFLLFIRLAEHISQVRGAFMVHNTSFAARIRESSVVRYGISLASVALALALGRTYPLLGGAMPYVAVLPAVAFSAWYCGLGPSIASSTLALATLKYFLVTPGHVLRILTVRQALDVVALIAILSLVLLLGEIRRRELSLLRRSRTSLEERVQDRTAELDAANQSLRELTARLMQSQDEERRRIARELHDSVGQSLAAMTMNMTAVASEIDRLAQIKKAVIETLELAQGMNKEVRTVSYLLHPPLLDEAGLASALRWYVQGFSERSNIQVQLNVPEDFGRLPQELETALFRTVQECLTNIHRHSGSPVATIHLTRSDDEVELKVFDEGRGIPSERLDLVRTSGTPGVGIRGMRERLHQLGGTLEIQSNGKGTQIEARMPVTVSAVAA